MNPKAAAAVTRALIDDTNPEKQKFVLTPESEPAIIPLSYWDVEALKLLADFAEGKVRSEDIGSTEVEVGREKRTHAFTYDCAEGAFKLGLPLDSLVDIKEGDVLRVTVERIGKVEHPQGRAYRNVCLKHDDIDRHGEGCECGDCNRNGKSYGVGIYPVGGGEVLHRVYGPSEKAAMLNAKLECERSRYVVVEPPEEDE